MLWVEYHPLALQEYVFAFQRDWLRHMLCGLQHVENVGMSGFIFIS